MENPPAFEAFLPENREILIWKTSDGNKELKQTKELQKTKWQNIDQPGNYKKVKIGMF